MTKTEDLTIVKIKAKDLITYRHSIQVRHGDGEPYWCHAVMTGWTDDLKRVKVMLGNHCFVWYDAEEEITVSVEEPRFCTPKPLPNRRDVLLDYEKHAEKALAEAQRRCEEAKERLAYLQRLKEEMTDGREMA